MATRTGFCIRYLETGNKLRSSRYSLGGQGGEAVRLCSVRAEKDGPRRGRSWRRVCCRTKASCVPPRGCDGPPSVRYTAQQCLWYDAGSLARVRGSEVDLMGAGRLSVRSRSAGRLVSERRLRALVHEDGEGMISPVAALLANGALQRSKQTRRAERRQSLGAKARKSW
jgi:hypothetical protein